MDKSKFTDLWCATSESIGEILERFVNEYDFRIKEDWEKLINIFNEEIECYSNVQQDIDWNKLVRKLKARNIHEGFTRYIIHRDLAQDNALWLLFKETDVQATKDVETHMAEYIEKECDWYYNNDLKLLYEVMEADSNNWYY